MGEEKGKLRERKSSEKRGGGRRKESYGQGEEEIESWGKRERKSKREAEEELKLLSTVIVSCHHRR